MRLAGTPATTVNGGTSLVTTAPAPTMDPSPTVTPGHMTHPAPIQTSLQILTGAGIRDALLAGSRSWLSVAITVLWPISTPSSRTMPAWSWNWQPALMNTFLPTSVPRPYSV